MMDQSNLGLFIGIITIGSFMFYLNNSNLFNFSYQEDEEESKTNENENNVEKIDEEDINNSFSEEERSWRLRLFTLIGSRRISFYRYYSESIILLLLDHLNFNQNQESLKNIISHWDWFNTILDIARNAAIRRAEDRIGFLIRNAGPATALYIIWYEYSYRRQMINSNNFLRNNYLYRYYLRLYRWASRRLSFHAGIPLQQLERVYLWYRQVIIYWRFWVKRRR